MALKGARELILRQKPIIFIEIEEQYLKDLGTSTKELIETIFSFNYALYRIENNYPCDHICVPIEKTQWFEDTIIKKLSFQTSKKIFGKFAKVSFVKSTDQIYKNLEIV